MVRIYLAGRVQVEGPGGVVTERELPGRQGKLMLARLALARAPVGHDVLADLFWGADRPAAWQATLSPLVSRLRGVLDAIGADGHHLLVARHRAYELVLPDRWIDIEVAIRSLDSAEAHVSRGDHATAWPDAAVASAILRRPFLEGEDHPWADVWRARTRDGMVRALACLAETWLAQARWPLAEQAAQEAIRIDPLREVAHRHLMLAMWGGGDGARALRAYHALERRLAEELGVPPSPATEGVYEQILGVSSSG